MTPPRLARARLLAGRRLLARRRRRWRVSVAAAWGRVMRRGGTEGWPASAAPATAASGTHAGHAVTAAYPAAAERVRGTGAVGQAVWVRAGRVEGAAPAMALVDVAV